MGTEDGAPDQWRYEGQYMNGLRHGVGFFVGTSCHFYGEWRRDQRWGRGVETCGSVRFEGSWVNDMKEGLGTYNWGRNALQYSGEYHEGRPSSLLHYIAHYYMYKLSLLVEHIGVLLTGDKADHRSHELPDAQNAHASSSLYCRMLRFYNQAKQRMFSTYFSSFASVHISPVCFDKTSWEKESRVSTSKNRYISTTTAEIKYETSQAISARAMGKGRPLRCSYDFGLNAQENETRNDARCDW